MRETRFAQLRSALVGALRVDRSSPLAARLDEVFAAVPRHRFLPRFLGIEGEIAAGLERAEERLSEGRALEVYTDQPLPVSVGALAHRSTSSAPGVMWTMLALLEPREGHRILEIGTGSGYNAAVLSHLVGPEGRVTTVECIESVAQDAAECLRLEGNTNVEVLAGDGTAGWPAGGPYDGVIVTAADPDIHPAWFEQLREGGRLVVVLDGLFGARLAAWRKREGLLVGGLGLRVSFVPIVGSHTGYPRMRALREQLAAAWRQLRAGPDRVLPEVAREMGPGVDTAAVLELCYGARADSGFHLSEKREVLLLSRDGAGVARVPLGLLDGWSAIRCRGGEAIDGELGALREALGGRSLGPHTWLPACARPIGGTAPLPLPLGGEREHFEYCVRA